MLILNVIIWCIVGYYGGLLFAKKGYPPHVGVVIGIFFGPCMLVACLLLPKTKEGKEQAILEQQIEKETAHQHETKKCPQCNRDLGYTAKICPRCEYRFE